MTNEEAIEELRSIMGNPDECYYCNHFDLDEEECKHDKCIKKEALNIAIKALSAEKTAECDNNHDCEHCDWTECPLEVEKENKPSDTEKLK